MYMIVRSLLLTVLQKHLPSAYYETTKMLLLNLILSSSVCSKTLFEYRLSDLCRKVNMLLRRTNFLNTSQSSLKTNAWIIITILPNKRMVTYSIANF